MKNMFKKYFSAQADNPAQAETQEEDVPMTQEEKQAQLAAETKTAELAASLEAASKALADKEQAFTELSTKLDDVVAKLAAADVEKASMVAQTKAKVQEARQAKLVAAVGSVQAPAMAASMESLSDTQFDAVVGAMAKTFEKESKSKMFTEQGADVKADAETITDPAKRLEAQIKAQFNTEGNK